MQVCIFENIPSLLSGEGGYWPVSFGGKIGKGGREKEENLKENEGRQKKNGNLKLKALNKCKKGKKKAKKGAHGINFAKMREEKKTSSGNMVFRPIYCPLS